MDKKGDEEVKAEESSAAKAKVPNPIDTNFEQLKIKMDTLDKASDDFKMIEEYVQNGKGHYNGLRIVDAFKIER